MSKRKDKAKPEIAIATPDEVATFAAESNDGAAAGATDDAESTSARETEGADAQPTLEVERDEWREKALRARADYQNLQRRAETERQQAVRYANAGFARDLLPVLDDIGRMVEAGRGETDRDTLVRSVEMVSDRFRKALSDHGITPIEADGQPFDPAIHQAFQQQPSEEHEPGTVLQVVEPGYTLHDRVLRPARVIISSALPAATADAESTEEGMDDHADV